VSTASISSRSLFEESRLRESAKLCSRLLWALVVLFACAARVPGYCPVPALRANGEFFKSDVIVVGTVLTVREVSASGDDPGGWYYGLQINETFRGTARERFTVYTENSSGRFPLRQGETYLLFARWENGRYEIGNCGNSELLSRATKSIQILKNLKAGRQPTEIEGWVVGETSGIDVSGVRVSIRGVARGYKAVTDKKGWLHLRVPPGQYSVDFSTNDYYPKGDDMFWYKPDNFTVHPGECASLQFVSARHRR